MTTVKFYSPDYITYTGFTYSVITARFNSEWIFVRHHSRTTLEIPGGHIEAGETPDETARRELAEETGAIDFNIECIASYSVEKDGSVRFGRLFFADVMKLGKILDSSEIEEVILSATLPDNLTYPDIQPHLFKKVLEYLRGR
jgi:8-oxo-dGTP diphosphatase